MQFCLLEQFLPEGQHHPFAQKMLQHFENLRTPLKSIKLYPRLEDVEERFRQSGWPIVRARTLWDIFGDPGFVSTTIREELDEIEPFDEWEDFVLFASHYFLLTAEQRGQPNGHTENQDSVSSPLSMSTSDLCMYEGTTHKITRSPTKRFGATAVMHPYFAHHGGFGPQTRTKSMDTYSMQEIEKTSLSQSTVSLQSHDQAFIHEPEARMCHTISPTSHGSLLVGGRKSPNDALSDCWTRRNTEQSWQRAHDLPFPLFRQCAVALSMSCDGIDESAVLVYGGKTSARAISNVWLLWRDGKGWQEVASGTTDGPEARFGAALAITTANSGLLLGGMTPDRQIAQQHWSWHLSIEDHTPKISCTRLTFDHQSDLLDPYLSRFGATVEIQEEHILLIGGIANKIIPHAFEILSLKARQLHHNEAVYQMATVGMDIKIPRSLLIGHSTCSMGDFVFIVGGGAVCFSFGTFWNESTLVLSAAHKTRASLHSSIYEAEDMKTKAKTKLRSPRQRRTNLLEIQSVKRQSLRTASEFDLIVSARQPAIFPEVNLGQCLSAWESLDKLRDMVGPEREVTVHQSEDAQMDFQSKNFQYVKKSFGQFLDDVEKGSKEYLRSLAADEPARKPANLDSDFPLLAADFQLPAAMQMAKEYLHSSVLRISGPVNMWLHYDVRL